MGAQSVLIKSSKLSIVVTKICAMSNDINLGDKFANSFTKRLSEGRAGGFKASWSHLKIYNIWLLK